MPSGWSNQLCSFNANAVSVTLVYRYRPKLVRMYFMNNDNEYGLGSTPWPNSKLNGFVVVNMVGLTI